MKERWGTESLITRHLSPVTSFRAHLRYATMAAATYKELGKQGDHSQSMHTDQDIDGASQRIG